MVPSASSDCVDTCKCMAQDYANRSGDGTAAVFMIANKSLAHAVQDNVVRQRSWIALALDVPSYMFTALEGLLALSWVQLQGREVTGKRLSGYLLTGRPK